MSERVISIHTDGSCLGNPGPGGWGVAVQDSEKQSWDEYSGFARDKTTNNRMELEAGFNGLLLAKSILSSNPNVRVVLYSDSEYFIRGITSWSDSWRIRNFKGVKNDDLWRTIITESDALKGKIDILWEKGHANSEGNNRADQLARRAAAVSAEYLKNK